VGAELDTLPMLVFGVAGCVLKERDYPRAPLVTALVLRDRTEEAFRRSLLVSQGDLGASGSLLWPAARRERPSPA
jgi:putative tricarboxylic transport membrane protein